MSQTDFDKKIKSLLNETVPLMGQAELREKINNNEVLILDSRTQKEYETSHIESAIFVDYDNFSEEMVAELDKEKSVVVYCSVGYRSEKIGEKLQKFGFKEVYNLYGGIFDWKNNGGEVVNKSGVTDSVHTYNKKWSQWLINGIRVY
ncbi:rhodanese-like domain-containing protein [Fulvivirga sp. RKSG066]|nr:rhodanese-like domain-containing protein [Fulvivirga aurantia]